MRSRHEKFEVEMIPSIFIDETLCMHAVLRRSADDGDVLLPRLLVAIVAETCIWPRLSSVGFC